MVGNLENFQLVKNRVKIKSKKTLFSLLSLLLLLLLCDYDEIWKSGGRRMEEEEI